MQKINKKVQKDQLQYSKRKGREILNIPRP